MKYSEKLVFYRTKRGEDEILKRDNSILPKALRSILLFIDGKTTLKQYREALNNSQLLSSVGTVDQCLDTLMELSLVNAKGLSGDEQSEDFSDVSETISRQTEAPSLENNFEQRQLFEKYRSIAIQCIESDLGTDSWEASLQIEECTDKIALAGAIEKIFNANKKSFSKESKKVLVTLFKKINNE